MQYRKPPKPIHYLNPIPGVCRFCGEPIFKENGSIKTRAYWHKPCLLAYKAIYWPQETRKAVWRRDKGQCANCSTILGSLRGAWHVDHVKPLIEAKGDLDYWRLENLATLCVPCHHAKTAQEATARAAKRREDLSTLRRG